MTIEKPTYVKAGALLMLLYATILNHAQYSFYYKQLFCPKDTVIVEKKDCSMDTDNAATIIQSACLNKLNVKPQTNQNRFNSILSKIWIL